MRQGKPPKRKDRVLWRLIQEKIESLDYVITKHAKQRQKERFVNDLDVLHILENKKGRKRKRNKAKDRYTVGYKDWCYCIEGRDLCGGKIRIVLTFDESLMLIVTVIRLENQESIK